MSKSVKLRTKASHRRHEEEQADHEQGRRGEGPAGAALAAALIASCAAPLQHPAPLFEQAVGARVDLARKRRRRDMRRAPPARRRSASRSRSAPIPAPWAAARARSSWSREGGGIRRRSRGRRAPDAVAAPAGRRSARLKRDLDRRDRRGTRTSFQAAAWLRAPRRRPGSTRPAIEAPGPVGPGQRRGHPVVLPIGRAAAP